MIAETETPRPSETEKINKLEGDIEQIKEILNEDHFLCLQDGTSEELKSEIKIMKENQNLICGELSGLREAVDSIQDSQERMFRLIERQNERLDSGDKFFGEIKKYMVKKDTENGFRDKEVKVLKEDVGKKATKEEVKEDQKTTHDWVKQIAKNQDKQDEKTFRLMLALVVGLLALAGSLLLAYLGIL